MTVIQWGIWATGLIAQDFTKDLQTSGHNVAAVGSRQIDRARAFAQQFDLPKAHGSLEDLVADPAVDVVYVASPHPFHLEAALAAVEAGKAVLVEKPFTLTGEQARQLRQAGIGRGVVVMEAMWTRFLPHYRYLRRLVDQGQIGDVLMVAADHTQSLPTEASHRLNDLKLGGGALLDLGVYPISLAYDLLGPPSKVAASATFKPTGADAQVATVFDHADGRRSYTLSASNAQGANRATIIGSQGRVELERVWYMPTTLRHYDAAGQLVETWDQAVAGRGMQFQAEHLEQLMVAGPSDSPIMPMDQSVAIMELLDQIRSIIGLKYPSEGN
ncbi:MAG: Gfo/Idh/MocA family oxidoreductase [Micrococcales bacterium]|nr:Gfo/Idh/MocA family oxidoreductase [Micrococcales bacterium]